MSYEQIREEALGLPAELRRDLAHELVKSYSTAETRKWEDDRCSRSLSFYLSVAEKMMPGVSGEMILMKNKTYPFPQMRSVIFYKLRSDGFSFPCIGKTAGFHHSTVVIAVEKLEGVISKPAYNPDMYSLYSRFNAFMKMTKKNITKDNI